MKIKNLLLSSMLLAGASTLCAQSSPIVKDWSSSIDAPRTFFNFETYVSTTPSDRCILTETGELIVAGVFTEEFEFAGTTLEGVAAGSTYILKYAADGKPLWAASIFGAAIPTAITTDAEGNLYIAGKYADEITFKGTTEKTISKEGRKGSSKLTTAFIVKYDNTGVPMTAETVIPVNNSSIPENLAYLPDDSELYFDISALKVFNNKLYLSAAFTGDNAVGTLLLKGSFLNIFDFMATDDPSGAVLSFDADLTNPEVASSLIGKSNEQFSNTVTDVHFTTDADNLYVHYVAFGNLTLTIGAENKEISMPITEEGGDMVRARVHIISALDKTHTKVWEKEYIAPAESIEKPLSATITGGMGTQGNTLYVVGRQSDTRAFVASENNLCLDNQDIFMVGVNKGDGTVTNYLHMGGDSIARPQAIINEKNIQILVNYKRTLKFANELNKEMQLPEVTAKYMGHALLRIAGTTGQLINYTDGDGNTAGIGLGANNKGSFAITSALKGTTDSYLTEVYKQDQESAINDVRTDATLSFYPNPTVDRINLVKAANVEIFSLQGVKLMSVNAATSVDVSLLPKGLYVVKVQSNDGLSTQMMTKN